MSIMEDSDREGVKQKEYYIRNDGGKRCLLV